MDTETGRNFTTHPRKNTEEEWEQKTHWMRYKWVYIFTLMEGIVIMFFGVFMTYGQDIGSIGAVTQDSLAKDTVLTYYPFFQDIHVMVFVGFGFLMTYLRSHSWMSMSINFVLGVWTIQIGFLFLAFWEAVFKWDEVGEEVFHLNVKHAIDADFAAASVLISYGAVMGKFNTAQYIIMATIQCCFYSLNYIIGAKVFYAVDIGGSMYIHTFGAYFGLACSFVSTNKSKVKDHPNNASNYHSNMFSFIGCIFLWMFWPSFNSAMSTGNARHRIIINTLLSISGSCFAVFVYSPLYNRGKYKMENILNATLAGGVCIGACSDLVLSSWAAILIGFGSGMVSFFAFESLAPFLQRKIGLYDTAGIHNLHGIPGFMGGIIGAICAGTVTESTFGDSAHIIFEKVSFTDPTMRTPNIQAGYQLAALALTLGLSISSGTITGFILKAFDGPEDLFTDRPFFDLEGFVHEDGLDIAEAERRMLTTREIYNNLKNTERGQSNEYFGTVGVTNTNHNLVNPKDIELEVKKEN
jgi:ammonium transporter Rh